MKIGLLGYGKMGKEIEGVAKQRSHSIAAIADPVYNGSSYLSEKRAEFAGCDVIMDFSTA